MESGLYVSKHAAVWAFVHICFTSAVSKYIVVSLEQVFVAPAHSLDYTLTPLSGDKYTSCLCGNERMTLSWNLSPKALGEASSFHPHFCQGGGITVPVSTSFKSLWNQVNPSKWQNTFEIYWIWDNSQSSFKQGLTNFFSKGLWMCRWLLRLWHLTLPVTMRLWAFQKEVVSTWSLDHS